MQTILVSATITPDLDAVTSLLLHNPVSGPSTTTASTITTSTTTPIPLTAPTASTAATATTISPASRQHLALR